VNRRLRIGLFLGGAALLAGMLVAAVGDLPGFGHYPGPYGILIEETGVAGTSATDLVTAVNFDYRAFDTMGEEFILFAAVLGVAIVLRRRRGERAEDERGDDHHFPGSSSALGALGLALVGPVFVLGAYVVTHGQITPGGGFQGGVVLAAALLLVYAAGQAFAVERVHPVSAVEVVEAVGALAFALVGVAGLVAAGSLFANVIGLAPMGSLLSGGTVPVLSVATGVEVAGALALILTELLDQTLVRTSS
jgi:multicomponent Na+:H+ antiporter subunit B